ncbi:MAG TPA: tail fiber protein [Aliidongia sp.]|uniref:phage tail protein n=1 Tax=Aliidongia sp. TaxID=1914230 RepID=UPI002DDDB8B0|nr:tail fiber protein [Aliidongia sp.]HEV2674546.1 tail fiber protein [Aliidongia sp.]
MSEPFLGECMIFAGNFAPQGFALCDGQLLPISQNTALFAILGTTYGGNGTTTFALPDFRGRLAVGQGQGPGLSPYNVGDQVGVESHALTSVEMPSHTHTVAAVANGTTLGTNVPGTGALLGSSYANEANNPTEAVYSTDAPTVVLGPVGNGGGNQPHENRMPFLAVTWCIALFGVFPSRN